MNYLEYARQREAEEDLAFRELFERIVDQCANCGLAQLDHVESKCLFHTSKYQSRYQPRTRNWWPWTK